MATWRAGWSIIMKSMNSGTPASVALPDRSSLGMIRSTRIPTVAVIVDLIIPKDERSGSATEAGVPEFMDFMMIDQPRRQTAMRGGLAAIDRLCEERFDKRLVDCADAQRRAILDDLAFPAKATPATSQAVAFFSSFRDLTASGFWSSKMGVDDLRYIGNTYVREWKGCPDEALKKLGVSYEAD